jgi:hypothetical protein
MMVIFPFYAMGFGPELGNEVTLHFDQSFRDISNSKRIVENAIGKWEASCNVVQLPIELKVDAVTPRPPVQGMLDEAYRYTMLISLDPTKEVEVRDKEIVLADWLGDKNRIVLRGKCPTDGTYGLPCAAPGMPIDWARDPDWATRILVHELGHAMGLDHDGDERNCRETFMSTALQPGIEYPIEVYHCRLIRLLNDHTEGCNSLEKVEPGKPHPCDAKATDRPHGPVNPGGPGGMAQGGAGRYCSEFPGLCAGTPQLAWIGSGIACNWFCVSWSGGYGDKGSGCQWDCEAMPLLAEGDVPQGAGPRLAFLNVREGTNLAGRAVLRGFAMDYSGVASIDFYWNQTRINPRSLQVRLPSAEACSLPLGWPHSHCVRNSGFLAEIDTTLLPNGPGTLGLVATDVDGWTSSLQLELNIANTACGDVAAPQVQVVRPSAGAAVGGLARVEVSANDDFVVQSVELLANGQRVGLRASPPYIFDWDTSGLPPGSRRLVARATDGCGNVGISPEVQVTVDNRQSSYLGAPPLLPNRIQAEHYDLGLPGVAYHDSTPGNAGGQFRQDDVDVGTDSGQFVVGYVAAGEWLEYTVEAPFAERYRVLLRSASPGGAQVALAIDGVEAPAFSLPPSGGYTSWTVAAAPEALAVGAGRHVLRLRAATEGFNLDWIELEVMPGACVGGSTVGCLQNNRFAVSAMLDGQPATVASTRGDTVFYRVFDPQNVEVAIKVLDARHINGKFWVYHGSLTTLPYTVTITDTATGRSRTYVKSNSTLCGGSDTGTFPFAGGESINPLATCTDSPTSVCLLGERYKVEVLRGTALAGASRITAQTGSFTFFSVNNHEVVVKILDGSAWNGHRWVFFGSLTDQAYQVRVTDTSTGHQVAYESQAAFCGRHDFDDF